MSAYGRKQRDFSEKAALTRRKELTGGSGLNRLWRSMENGVWLTAIPRHLNGTELSWESFQDNLLLQYGIVPLNLPSGCDSFEKNLLVRHALSCPKGGLVLERHNYASKEWGALSVWALNPTAIS